MKLKTFLILIIFMTFSNFIRAENPAVTKEAANIIQQLRFEAERKDVEIEDLKEQNKLLKEEVERLRKYVNELSIKIKNLSSKVPSVLISSKPEEIEQDENFIYHTVKPGDNLTWLSLKYYKASRFWNRIYEANKDRIGSDYMLRVGQKLKIPK